MGQNFLVDPTVSKNIVDLLNVDTNDKVLEVGPGLGSLTHYLQNYNLDVCDIDKRMCDVISAIYHDKKNINIINETMFTIIRNYETRKRDKYKMTEIQKEETIKQI